ncbi:hypothetical protein [Owenweeksia hongkongensis]|uniref:hypothetical protein n=1 Tax=Owenweeksia hongkongensis TaxID=253245 RepID=UPI003A8FC5A7
MKRLTQLLLLCASFFAQAQQVDELVIRNSFPENRLSVGIVLSDFIVDRFRMEGAYRIAGPHTLILGVGTHFGRMDMDDNPFNRSNYPANSFYTNLGYKYYVFSSEKGNTFAFTKLHLSYENADVKYFEKDWVTEPSDGLTYYYYQDVAKYYHVENIAFGMEMGVELKAGIFFTEFSFGAQYKGVISNDTPPEEFSENSGDFFDDIDYSGIAPRLSIKMGFYLD